MGRIIRMTERVPLEGNVVQGIRLCLPTAGQTIIRRLFLMFPSAP
jgi:hypothetical protein